MAAVRRHDDDGNAIFTSDVELSPHDPTTSDGTPPSGDSTGFITIFRTEGLPAKIQKPYEEIHPKQIPLVTTSDVTCRIVDFPPATSEQWSKVNIMHRTQSLDYGIVLKGTIKCVLDKGVEKVFNEGDICIQRGTIHGWMNASPESCRMLFVLIPAERVKVKNTDKELEPTGEILELNRKGLEDDKH